MGTHTVFQCDVCGVEQRTSDFFQTPEGWTYVTCDSGVEEQRRFLICSVCKRTARLQAGAAKGPHFMGRPRAVDADLLPSILTESDS